MAGIVTTSSAAGDGSRIYRMVFTSTSTSLAINWISGTTSQGVTSDPLDKGVEVTFQNQSTAAVNVYIGPSNVAVGAGNTSTIGSLPGIALAQNGTYAIGKRHAPSAIQMSRLWVATTSSIAVVSAHLIHAI